jgi:predicted ATPase
MRLERIRVDNFKSLVDFQLQLAPFTCLIGLNGAGKSTVLQALDFASPSRGNRPTSIANRLKMHPATTPRQGR